MQPNFTLKKVGNSLKTFPVLFLLGLLIAGSLQAQQFMNSNLSTGTPNSVGVAAPAGNTWSELQPGGTTFGYSASTTAGFSVADDFTIQCGSWTINKLTFYGYSTGFAGTTSPFTDLRVAIYNTDPSVGNPAPIFGDRTTNRFSASQSALMYRVNTGASDLQRRIWAIEANIAGVTLGPGTYWIEWSMGAGALTNFSPPGTVVGTLTQPGNNAKQRTNASGAWANLLDGTNPQAMPFLVNYTSAACAGTPAPGNALSSATTACPGIPFNLSIQNCTPGSGVTYQWQSATALAGPYTNIPGATGATLSTSQSATTFYRVIVTCGANSGTSNPVQVLLTPSSGCYCAAGASSTAFEKISNVTFGTINNNSTSTAGYEDFTNLSTNMIHGQVAPISVTISGAFTSDQVIVWIDFNQNGSFLDPGERVYTSPQGAGPHVGNITISPTATLGPTRMRVRMHDAAFGGNTTPCGNSGFGQVEDYTVNIQPCVNVSITGQPASASVQCSANATFTVTATGSALIYAWEYRVNSSSPWQNVTNTGIYSGATTNVLTLTNVPSNMTGYQYRAVVSNPCTAIDFTSTATLTVVPLVATVTPTSATICTGSIQQLTLTNASSPTTQTFTATGLPIAIPDNNTTGINSSIPVSLPAGSVVTAVSVKFSIPAHTWPGDLAAVLRAPNGQILNLDYFISATGAGPGAGMVDTRISSAGGPLLSSVSAPYTGTFRADAVLTGVPAAGPVGFLPTTTTWTPLYSTPSGNWTLAIYDAFGGDFGSLTAWSIDITYGAPAAGVWTASPATPNTMWTNAGATVPYVAGSPATTIWVNPTVNTNYSVVYTTATPCTSAPTVIPVTVINPVGTVTQPANRSACIGGSTTFTASATGGPNTYQWQVSSNGGATWTNVAGATSTSLVVSNVTATMNNYLYRVLINAAPCAGTTTSSAATLTVNNPPTVTLSSPDLALAPGQTTTLTVTSNPAAAVNGYRWTLNGVALPASTNSQNAQTIGIDALGDYRVTVTDVNGCVAQSNTLTVGGEASDKLWIYPNPSRGAFQVRLYYGGTTTERRMVSIYTMGGQLVEQREFTLNSTSNPYLRMDFDLGKMADGAYVVKVHNRHTNHIVSGLVVLGRD